MSMLNPTTDRLDYGKLLMPPEGYETSFAIGTTYSLNLETMLHIPLALFHSKYLSEATDIHNLRADMLDALQKMKNKVFVFVHANNIKVSTKYNMLYNFLDQSIVNIGMDKAESNFHPKMWLIRYESKDDYCYRLVILSRNLAPSTDFDIAASFDSFQTDSETNQNAALIDFCGWLMRKSRNKNVMRIIRRELKRVKFDVPFPFVQSSFAFHPHTLKTNRHELTCPLINDSSWEESLIISPFVKKDALEKVVNKTSGNCFLISRKEELDKIDRNVIDKFSGGVYQFTDIDEIDEDNDDASLDMRQKISVNLHAKLYIVKARLWKEHQANYHWYIGSTNCTDAALEKNIETLVHLKALKQYGTDVSPRAIVTGLLDSKQAIIEPYNCNSKLIDDHEAESLKYRLRELKWTLSKLNIAGSATGLDKNKFRISVSVNSIEYLKRIKDNFKDMTISMRLFSNDHDCWNITSEDSYVFTTPLSSQNISPFLIVTIKYGDNKDEVFLLKMDMEIPKDRESRMMAEILDSEEKLMKYLMFLLDNDMDTDDLNIGIENAKVVEEKTMKEQVLDYRTPIMEKMLLTASRNKKALARMGETIDKIKGMKDMKGHPLLSRHFLSFWNTFKEFAYDK